MHPETGWPMRIRGARGLPAGRGGGPAVEIDITES
jgi:hypothetical protein